MEDSPCEAVKNNVFGTYNVAVVADEYKVNKMVILSTDKAVNPTNVMGCTKRITEIIVQYMNDKSKNTKYAAVRFGNVLGSHGSVVRQAELPRAARFSFLIWENLLKLWTLQKILFVFRALPKTKFLLRLWGFVPVKSYMRSFPCLKK